MQLSNLYFLHGLFDLLTVTFQGQTVFDLKVTISGSNKPACPKCKFENCILYAGSFNIKTPVETVCFSYSPHVSQENSLTSLKCKGQHIVIKK